MKKIFAILLAAAFVACSSENTPAEQSAPAPVKIDHAAYSSPNADAQQRVYDYMKGIGVFYIATVDGDQPRVRPFGALHIYEGKTPAVFEIKLFFMVFIPFSILFIIFHFYLFFL